MFLKLIPFVRIVDLIPAIKDYLDTNDLKLTDKDDEAINQFKQLSSFKRINYSVKVLEYDVHLKNLMIEKEIKFEDIQQVSIFIFIFFAPMSKISVRKLGMEYVQVTAVKLGLVLIFR